MAFRNVYQFNKSAIFGTVESAENPKTGVPKQQFKKLLTLKYRSLKRHLTQVYTAEQAGMLDTKTIEIRHNKQVSVCTKCLLGGVEYDIISIDPDESLAVNKYDMITLRKSKRSK